MTAIDSVPVPTNDIESASTRARSGDFAIFGTASPPVAAGAMLLMFNLAIALFIDLGPIFILCLLFEQTKPLFNKWLMYGIGTLFGMAMLSFVSTIVLKVTLAVAEGLWTSSVIAGLLGVSSEGLSSQSMEQGGESKGSETLSDAPARRALEKPGRRKLNSPGFASASHWPPEPRTLTGRPKGLFRHGLKAFASEGTLLFQGLANGRQVPRQTKMVSAVVVI